MILHSILGAVKSIFWSILLTMTITFVFGIFFWSEKKDVVVRVVFVVLVCVKGCVVLRMPSICVQSTGR